MDVLRSFIIHSFEFDGTIYLSFMENKGINITNQKVRRHIQSLTRLVLAFILIFSSVGLEGKIHPAAAAAWTSFNHGFGTETFGNEVAYGNGTWLLFSQSRDFGKLIDSSGTAFQKSGSFFPCTVIEAKHFGTQWFAACNNG